MTEQDEDWLFMLGFCLFISWVGALAVWVLPSFSTLPPVKFGLYFSGMSFVGCGVGWLVGLKQDC
ncbi:hypothetical protein ES703_50792 [subsurface metagenome]